MRETQEMNGRVGFSFFMFTACMVYHSVEDFEKIRKNDVTLRRDNTIFKVIIASTLKEFCFRVKSNSPLGYNKITNYRKQISVIPLKSIPTKLCIWQWIGTLIYRQWIGTILKQYNLLENNFHHSRTEKMMWLWDVITLSLRW